MKDSKDTPDEIVNDPSGQKLPSSPHAETYDNRIPLRMLNEGFNSTGKDDEAPSPTAVNAENPIRGTSPFEFAKTADTAFSNSSTEGSGAKEPDDPPAAEIGDSVLEVSPGASTAQTAKRGRKRRILADQPPREAKGRKRQLVAPGDSESSLKSDASKLFIDASYEVLRTVRGESLICLDECAIGNIQALKSDLRAKIKTYQRIQDEDLVRYASFLIKIDGLFVKADQNEAAKHIRKMVRTYENEVQKLDDFIEKYLDNKLKKW